jgi:excisionase family DNA binding protein
MVIRSCGGNKGGLRVSPEKLAGGGDVKTAQELQRLLSAKEVADVLRVSRVTVWRLAQHGALRPVRIGRAVRFHPRDVERLVREGAPTR